MSVASMIDTDVAFLDRLRRLTRQEKACLRRFAGKGPWSPDVLSVVAPYLPNSEGSQRDFQLVRLSVVATLYACHDKLGGRATVGAAMARLAVKSESVAERLMRQVLSTDTVDGLGRGPLLRIVKALSTAAIPLDWSRLLRDMSEWQEPRKKPQQQWAKDFWGARRGGQGEQKSD